jgi:hypothetical protein
MEFSQICDRVEIDPVIGPMDISGMPGTWINSNPDTNGIARIVLSESGGNLSLQTYAVGPDRLLNWGTAAVEVFASAPAGRVAAGFTSSYDFGFVETRLLGMIMKGLLVLAQLHNFKDESGRANYFVREYFALAHQPYLKS